MHRLSLGGYCESITIFACMIHRIPHVRIQMYRPHHRTFWMMLQHRGDRYRVPMRTFSWIVNNRSVYQLPSCRLPNKNARSTDLYHWNNLNQNNHVLFHIQITWPEWLIHESTRYRLVAIVDSDKPNITSYSNVEMEQSTVPSIINLINQVHCMKRYLDRLI